MAAPRFSSNKIKKDVLEKVHNGVSTRKIAHFLCKEYNNFKGHKREVLKLLNSINPLLAFETERSLKRRIQKRKMKK